MILVAEYKISLDMYNPVRGRKPFPVVSSVSASSLDMYNPVRRRKRGTITLDRLEMRFCLKLD